MPVEDSDAFIMFAKAANCKHVLDYIKTYSSFSVIPQELLLESPVYNNTALMYMYQEKWLGHYKNALGANYWAAYNTLTDWSSHGPQAKKGRRVEQNNIASLNYDRSQKVIAVVKDNFRLAA